jgi:hypothetical protein
MFSRALVGVAIAGVVWVCDQFGEWLPLSFNPQSAICNLQLIGGS